MWTSMKSNLRVNIALLGLRIHHEANGQSNSCQARSASHEQYA